MYQKSSGLTKFVLLFADMVCIAISLLAADYLWHDVLKNISRGGANYKILLLYLLAVYVVLFLFVRQKGSFYVRGHLLELWAVIKNNMFLILGVTLVMFFVKQSDKYSRMVLGIFVILNCLLSWAAHEVLKGMIPYVYKAMVNKHNAIIVGSLRFAFDIIEESIITKDFSTEYVGKCIVKNDYDDTDPEMKFSENSEASGIEKLVENIPEIPLISNLTDFCKNASVDEVIVEVTSADKAMLKPIINELSGAGIIIKCRSRLLTLSSMPCQAVTKAGGYFEATYANTTVSNGNLIVKRMFDIFAGLIGSIVTIILMIFIAPAIKLESKGPVLFKQVRMGRNGRRFVIYKFRSMSDDAEKRKKDLMSQNEMGDKMFKMEDDPRITKVGKFLRKTSLDEFPQFFNILLGDMSLVGTRPPTADEFEKYNLNQKSRLSFRPGLTGLWQVSGRNAVKNFDDVVALDMEYIKNWSPLLDIKIMIKTIPAMFSGK